MPRKRDYKAEYQRRKQKAQQAGYKSERELKRARALQARKRSAAVIPKDVFRRRAPDLFQTFEHGRRDPLYEKRRAAAQWSRDHSRQTHTKYKATMSNDALEKYWRAFVEPLNRFSGVGKRNRKQRKIERLHDYMVPLVMSEEEWQERYGTSD